MHPSQQPFNNYEAGPDFDRARSQIATPFQYVDILLDVAGVNQVYNLSGDFLYVDAASTGTATLELNNQYNDPSAPFQVSAGFGLQALFKQIKLTWNAQAGKRLRLMYSTGDKIVPTNSTTISGSVSVSLAGNQYANSYDSTTALAANTPDTIFTPAANVSGAVVVVADYLTFGSAAYCLYGFIAKNAAPANILDGDLIILGASHVANIDKPAVLQSPIQIPAGKGLYRLCSVLEAAPLASCLYRFL